MKRFKLTKAMAVTMGAAMSLTAFAGLAGCGEGDKSLKLMTDQLDGLFSPFYSTTASDGEIAGQTQISLFTTNENGDLAVGENEACAALAYELKHEEQGSQTFSDYYFVLKNGLKFSDGVPLTMNDVFFNFYTVLDPTFAGSGTLYSTDILGLKDYRTQSKTSGDGNSAEDQLTQSATTRARQRRNELVEAFRTIGVRESSEGTYSASPDKMRSELGNANSEAFPSISQGYLDATGAKSQEEARTQIVADYNHIAGDPNSSDKDEQKGLFRKELESDFNSSKDAFKEAPYKDAKLVTGKGDYRTGFDDVTSFMFNEGYASVEYEMVEGVGEDRSKIKQVMLNYNVDTIKTMKSAIDFVYNDKITTAFDQIMNFWASGTNAMNEYVSKAKEIILSAKKGSVPRVEGIVSLGHTSNETTVSVGGKEYTVAHDHNADGTPVNANEYDVLRIRVNGIDPKAIWNFGISIAPHHYYSDPENFPVDIEHDQFGVDFGNFDFQMYTIQGKNANGDSKNSVPVGAGIYMASDQHDSDLPRATQFLNNNIVFYKANPYFMFPVKTKYLEYHVVSSANALGALTDGSAHFVSPQMTQANFATVTDPSFKSKGYDYMSAWQLGYGYIGINAGRVSNIYLRRAIMASMDTSTATTYYSSGSAVNIDWPMSAVSWAYPREEGYSYDGNFPTNHMKRQTDSKLSYAATSGWTDGDRRTAIKQYMEQANVKAGDPSLRIKFTIAGAELSEHPCYNTMHKSMDLLNQCGWDVTITPDPNALSKLATGSLDVWAAAWGSTLDPDMYQVYHKNSTATSVLAWGYREILADSSREEYKIVTELSNLIDDARRIDDREDRAAIYENAMKKVLELAVELPVYQRKTLYAVNLNAIDGDTLAKNEKGEWLINSYSSPLNRLWEVGLVADKEK